jgi:YfiH family protein
VSTRVELTHATVLFSGRADGDLGRTSGDIPAAVARNRAALVERCGVRAVAAGRQVHGSVVAVVGEAPAGYAVSPAAADGQATCVAAVAVGVHVADCLPVALAGAGGVAMLHCGWRGLAGGVIAEGIRVLRSLGVDGPLEAAIGPGAGVCCYETGAEVRAVFAAYATSDGPRIDLAAIAREQLHETGVEDVCDLGVCTICAPEGLYFSHRRDGADTGRQGGFVWRR